MRRTDGPTALILTRQKLPMVAGATAAETARGGYVLFDPPSAPEAILIATGSEVHVALRGRPDARWRTGCRPGWCRCRVGSCSRPSQPSIAKSVLPTAIRARVSMEAGASFGWERWIGDAGEAIALDRFGASAPGEVLFEQFGFTPEHAVAAVRRVLTRRAS